ncbi:probable ATP-dependent RNA helicase DDX56 isoform X2 [Rhinatrema bivittatum]|uniref:probable ATP-dependent RNA helicase DDX56 isoform X2 n=1 Tax=Rhinatrema bivittatum TaxID=194408 RepID=UPI00112A32EE|nr:probable ATP-dependent RNA helicase DDX56 isoform X2 [Rhinatrema bivittatum]
MVWLPGDLCFDSVVRALKMAASMGLGFHELGLDDRVLKAIADLGWARPTLIQEKAIPLALEGKDLLARARTGSGKTAAYIVPIIQHLLQVKMSVSQQSVRVLILVPTKELGQQVQQMIRQLTAYCARDVRVADVSGLVDVSAQSQFPKIYQAFLMSATFNEDVQALKELVLHNPVTLKLQESQLPDSSQLTQFQIKCEEEDKFLLLYTLLKLSLVRGKTIIFVNSIDRCYRLKLFLEQFSIPACVLNSELPVHSRCHIISQFNQGFYDYIIATDEHILAEPTGRKKKIKKAGRGETGKDKEYGVARGIDFQNVSNVINFDFPQSVESYIHRAGRTARADNPGTALTFISHTELPLLAEIEEALKGESSESVLRPYKFRMEEIEGFRYRCRDAMRSVTKQAIKEARLKEIKEELLNSEKLKTYFEDNPRDFQLLRHDKALHPAIVKPHLKNVPEYLIPPMLRGIAQPHINKKKRRRNAAGGSHTNKNFKFKGRQNPLHSFKYTGKKSQAKTPKGKQS